MTKRIITPFANSGTKNTIPDTAPGSDDGFANYPNGFPASNSVDPALGGSYVKRADFNGAMYDVTSILKDLAQGLLYTYDSTYSTAIGGYPANALLSSLTGGLWLNVLGSANTSNPDTGGAGWMLINPARQVPVGTIFPYTGSSTVAPTGYVFDGSILNRTTYADLFDLWVTSKGYTAQTFTVTIAAPAVFTKTAHGFTTGERLRLFTTGALPTGLNTTADYFVEAIDANTFYLTTSKFGFATRIATTGTQSGTHTYLQSLYGLGDGSTTFNAPNIADLFIRGLSASGRLIGTMRKGTLVTADTTNGTPGDMAMVTAESQGFTLAQQNSQLGFEAYTTTDYPFVTLNTTTTSATGLPIPGTGVIGITSSPAIPPHISFPHIIKY